MSFWGTVRRGLLGPPTQASGSDSDELLVRSTDLFQSQVNTFWASLTSVGFSPSLIEKVWIANRCIGLNAQQIARMPLRFHGAGGEPAWVSAPDPVWFPNGVGDAVYAAVDSMYRWGDAFLYVTSRYANGFPSGWTVLDAARVTVGVERGRRTYRIDQTDLDASSVVQVSRDPRGLRGTSAIESYSSQAYGLLAASDLGRVMMSEGSVPNAVLKSKRKLTADQATALQEAWVARTAVRRGAPAVLPPDIEFEQLSFSPGDLMLLDVQRFDSQVIASAFGVPALFVNLPIEGGLNYQSPAMLGEHWWRFELRPIAAALSQALSAQMLPRGNWVEFDARATLAPAFGDTVEAWVKMFEQGLVSAEEFRVAVLQLSTDDTLAALTTPPSAGASPTQQQQTSSVVALRPTQAVNQ